MFCSLRLLLRVCVRLVAHGGIPASAGSFAFHMALRTPLSRQLHSLSLCQVSGFQLLVHDILPSCNLTLWCFFRNADWPFAVHDLGDGNVHSFSLEQLVSSEELGLVIYVLHLKRQAVRGAMLGIDALH